MINLSLEFENYPLKELREGTSVFSGFAFKSSDFTTEGIPVIKIKNIQNQHVNLLEDNEYFPFSKLNSKHDKFILKNNDVLIAMTGQGSLGRVGRIKLDKDELMLVNQRVGKFITDEENFHLNYLYHVLSSKTYEKILFDRGTGSGQPNLSPEIILGTEVPCPDLNTQKKIAYILDQIDNLILLNKKINHNLEEIIKKIYINWFEEFEPFKNEGFYDTKLGEIPIGWKVEPLQDFIKFQEGPGIRNWQYVEEDGVNFLNIRCIQDNDLILDTANMISKEEAEGKYSHFMLNEWDIVISSSGTLGRYAIVRKEHLPLCLNTSIIRFAPKHSFNHYSYVYSYLTSRGFYHYLLTMGSGSVQLNFGPTHLKQIDLIVPPEEVLNEYNDLIFPLIVKMKSLKSEIDQLIKLRDTLLPKLMSGEIDVSKINCDL